jgi:hypothetical protein
MFSIILEKPNRPVPKIHAGGNQPANKHAHWMNDPKFNGQTYEWDTVGTSDNWRQTHNYKHHTYTNIHNFREA